MAADAVDEAINGHASRIEVVLDADHRGATVTDNGRGIPVVSFEGACGKRIPVIGGRTRIVIFTCLGQKLPAGHFGIATQGFPQLVRLSPEVVHYDDSRSFGERSPVVCQVRMVNEYPLVPDFERIESDCVNIRRGV